MVAIAYGKGVVLRVPYTKMDGPFFAQFIKEHFRIAFGRAGPKQNGRRLFIMDNDPCQTSKVAMKVCLISFREHDRITLNGSPHVQFFSQWANRNTIFVLFFPI
jgi:hypothetical protein